MYTRIHYYTLLTFLDIVKLWSSVLHHVVIVAGIYLPVLLLLGLNNGQIAKLSESLTKNSSGREIAFNSGMKGEILTASTLDEFQKTIPGIELIIPDRQPRTVALVNGNDVADSVALLTTRPGDPILGDYKIDIDEYKKDALPQIVLSPTVAEQIKVKAGDEVTLRITRGNSGKEESAETQVIISAILSEKQLGKPEDKVRSAIGRAHFEFILDLERYNSGWRVERYGWPSSSPPPKATYTGYLIFTKKSNPLTEDDIKKLKEYYWEVQTVEDVSTKTLGGYLKEDAVDKLAVYRCFLSGNEAQEWGDKSSESNIGLREELDAVLVPWNKPKKMKVDGVEHEVIGVTLPDTWLVRQFLKEKSFFDAYAAPYSILLLDGAVKERVVVESQKDEIPLKVVGITPTPTEINLAATPPETVSPAEEPDKEIAIIPQPADSLFPPPATHHSPLTTRHSTAIVPSVMLAYLHAHQHDYAIYDAAKQKIVQVPGELQMLEFRTYAKTIYDVTPVVAELTLRKFGTFSQQSLIEQLGKRIGELKLTVWIVGLSIFGAGVITVFSVLLDSTDRKRGTIGIMRVMGVSRFGVCYFILLRSFIIGLLAIVVTLLTLVIGVCLQYVLNKVLGFQSVSVIYTLSDIALVSAGALLCCCLGALIPALKAGNMDPFDAIMEGKFR